jgi:hypothetical protein
MFWEGLPSGGARCRISGSLLSVDRGNKADNCYHYHQSASHRFVLRNVPTKVTLYPTRAIALIRQRSS